MAELKVTFLFCGRVKISPKRNVDEDEMKLGLGDYR